MTKKFATELSQAWKTGGILFDTPEYDAHEKKITDLYMSKAVE